MYVSDENVLPQDLAPSSITSQTSVLANGLTMNVLDPNAEVVNSNIREETVANVIQIEVPSPQTPSNAGPIRNSRNNKRTYTPEDLTAAVNAVISNDMKPIQAIDMYKIARRTFFRRLGDERKKRGIPNRNNRSRSSSRRSSRSSTPTTPAASLAPTTSPDSVELFSPLLNYLGLVKR